MFSVFLFVVNVVLYTVKWIKANISNILISDLSRESINDISSIENSNNFNINHKIYLNRSLLTNNNENPYSNPLNFSLVTVNEFINSNKEKQSNDFNDSNNFNFDDQSTMNETFELREIINEIN